MTNLEKIREGILTQYKEASEDEAMSEFAADRFMEGYVMATTLFVEHFEGFLKDTKSMILEEHDTQEG